MTIFSIQNKNHILFPINIYLLIYGISHKSLLKVHNKSKDIYQCDQLYLTMG